jgi:D-alanyl-D-alanine carboxypeptidase (penicillin-binding protein 5/6)
MVSPVGGAEWPAADHGCCRGSDSFNQRIEESVRLMQWGFNAWQAKPLFKKGDGVGTARVQLGERAKSTLVAPRDLSVTIPAGVCPRSVDEDPLPGPVKAPIAKASISPTWW